MKSCLFNFKVRNCTVCWSRVECILVTLPQSQCHFPSPFRSPSIFANFGFSLLDSTCSGFQYSVYRSESSRLCQGFVLFSIWWVSAFLKRVYQGFIFSLHYSITHPKHHHPQLELSLFCYTWRDRSPSDWFSIVSLSSNASDFSFMAHSPLEDFLIR